MQSPDPLHDHVRVLAVCTGNVCRSPATELLLRTILAGRPDSGGLPVTVSSAGTGALVGAQVDPPTARLLAAEGVATGAFTARQLTRELVEEADVVLALTREHRRAIVTLVPRAVHRTWTLRELSRLLRAAGLDGQTAEAPSSLPDLLAAVRTARPHSRAAAPEDDDVEDPFHRPDEVLRTVWEQIVPATHVIGSALAALRTR